MNIITGFWSVGLILLTMQVMIGIYDNSGFSSSMMFHFATLMTGFIFGRCVNHWVAKK